MNLLWTVSKLVLKSGAEIGQAVVSEIHKYLRGLRFIFA